MEEGSRLAPGKIVLVCSNRQISLKLIKKECYDEKSFTS